MPGSKRLAAPLTLEKSLSAFHKKSFDSRRFIYCGLHWSGLFHQTKEMTRAEGEITPIGRIYLVQHLEGGILSDIVIHEGKVVEKGFCFSRQLLEKKAVSGLRGVVIQCSPSLN